MLRKRSVIYEFENRERIILRDHLALERTRLANERTLMSYVRTSLYLILAAVGFLELEGLNSLRWIGYVLIPLSLFVVVAGIARFIYLKNHLKTYYSQYDQLPEPPGEQQKG
jgi:putative membrane protein